MPGPPPPECKMRMCELMSNHPTSKRDVMPVVETIKEKVPLFIADISNETPGCTTCTAYRFIGSVTVEAIPSLKMKVQSAPRFREIP
mmetsp:Transcript_58383/g.153685  ORF Transcript_58383/g.153685 Transcript_58383/m.153685 type:complete len:87 (-) Transcript_58383:2616-2876(-)